MKTIDEIRAFFRQDRFATDQGITIESAREGHAVCRVTARPHHCNAMGSVQGGLLFTLADFAFAVAANCRQCDTVTLNSSISYFRPPKGEVLTATAACVHRSKSTCVYQIDITDELETQVARVSTTGYILPQAMGEEQP